MNRLLYLALKLNVHQDDAYELQDEKLEQLALCEFLLFLLILLIRTQNVIEREEEEAGLHHEDKQAVREISSEFTLNTIEE